MKKQQKDVNANDADLVSMEVLDDQQHEVLELVGEQVLELELELELGDAWSNDVDLGSMAVSDVQELWE